MSISLLKQSTRLVRVRLCMVLSSFVSVAASGCIFAPWGEEPWSLHLYHPAPTEHFCEPEGLWALPQETELFNTWYSRETDDGSIAGHTAGNWAPDYAKDIRIEVVYPKSGSESRTLWVSKGPKRIGCTGLEELPGLEGWMVDWMGANEFKGTVRIDIVLGARRGTDDPDTYYLRCIERDLYYVRFMFAKDAMVHGKIVYIGCVTGGTVGGHYNKDGHLALTIGQWANWGQFLLLPCPCWPIRWPMEKFTMLTERPSVPVVIDDRPVP